MKTMTRCSGWVGILSLFLLPLSQAAATAPVIVGQIKGVEVAQQTLDHGAVFVFSFFGTLNGRPSIGSGWIEVSYDRLPTADNTTPGEITGGEGVVWIGLRRFAIDVTGGQLTFDTTNPLVFGVTADLMILNSLGESTAEVFTGAISHKTFPPTICGKIGLP